ncbi:F-box protein At4g09920-like [Hibiscus syriacus]|uniref:F-box protein At4g09920-like n=1 Tax=Hibiscus syriacus TaxID=106335 RepID=UPI0019207EAA|nr:F-box protein At4g09920-like [Hibiscus syriacus]
MKGVDRISGLPDSILGHILSFLSTVTAVQTSVLSTRWRDLFTLVSALNFEFEEQHMDWSKRHKSSTVKNFMCFVDRVLFFHRANVDKFRLKCGKRVDSDRIYGWISVALWRGYKHLDLNITLDKFTLPGALFTCRTLVTLKLDIGFVLDVPKGVHFPNLETLQLNSVEFFNDNSVINLFSSCSSLEDVVISRCNMKNISSFNISHHFLKKLTILDLCNSSKYWLMIDTPNLAYFRYNNCIIAGYSLENLTSIVCADIQFQIKDDDDLLVDITDFSKVFCIVGSLTLSLYSLQLLLRCESLPVFSTMIKLKICSGYHRWLKDGGLETLLSRSPELEKLSFPREALRSLPEEVPSCLLFKLKAIEISFFENNEECIRKAKYIIKNGGALENFTIFTYGYGDEKERLKISKVLLASPRKSNKCNFLICLSNFILR